jgi:thiol-disulfide isomerase/thioredoxin
VVGLTVLASVTLVAQEGSTADAPSVNVGAVAPDFELPRVSPRGGPAATFKLSSLRGKVVLVDLWATWCEPCKRALPELAKLQRSYAPRGFDVVAVALDEDVEAVARFVRERGVSELTTVLDPTQWVPQRWQPRKLPTSYLVDRNGTVRLRLEGYDASTVARLSKILEELLGARVSAPSPPR